MPADTRNANTSYTRLAKIRKDKGKRADGGVECVLSTEAIASDGLIIRKRAWAPILPGGDEAERTIPVTAGHVTNPEGQAVPAIGYIPPKDRWWEEGVGFVGVIRFVDEKINPQGPRWQKAMQSDIGMDAVSVSWRNSEFAEKPENPERAPEVIGLRLREVACVLDGADPGAVKRAAEYGIEIATRAVPVTTTVTEPTNAPVTPPATATVTMIPVRAVDGEPQITSAVTTPAAPPTRESLEQTVLATLRNVAENALLPAVDRLTAATQLAEYLGMGKNQTREMDAVMASCKRIEESLARVEALLTEEGEQAATPGPARATLPTPPGVPAGGVTPGGVTPAEWDGLLTAFGEFNVKAAAVKQTVGAGRK